MYVQPSWGITRVTMEFRRHFINLIEKAERYIDLRRQVIELGSQRRPATPAIPPFDAFGMHGCGSKRRCCGQRGAIKCCKGGNRRTRPSAAIATMAVGNRLQRL